MDDDMTGKADGATPMDERPEDLLSDPSFREAAREIWHGRVGPEVSAWTISQGATGGFGEDLARVVLADGALVSQVNGIWESLQTATGAANRTGLDALPVGFRRAIRQEERDGLPKLNLDIAHAAGRCWTDADWDADLFSLELEACAFDGTTLAAVGVRGDDGPASAGTVTGRAERTEPWEVQFHADHLTVLARRHDTNPHAIVVRLESDADLRTYRITLHWPDGTSSTLEPVTAGAATRPIRFGRVASPGGALPVRISVAAR
ncbi:hypothetical protein JS531_02035 [Bifidobacterium sp. CP2]|uniref:hypothetical protein n=1 Tax=Bifidobacterium sp. CP2 TaxID=2809025 RepID=UPI001BDD492E|nr:hypothetical protein [Bifidobacterium sp. CP2]MBT1180770.1 hypothetical protein [Bifidobacterium sp. CP2]